MLRCRKEEGPTPPFFFVSVASKGVRGAAGGGRRKAGLCWRGTGIVEGDWIEGGEKPGGVQRSVK